MNTNNLQNEDIDNDEFVEGTDDTGLDGSDPSSDGNHEQSATGAEDNSEIHEAVARQHAKFREEQRRREAAEQELEQLRRKSQAEEQVEPVIPPIPDAFDDDFQGKMEARDKALNAHFEWKQKKAQKPQQNTSDGNDGNMQQAQEVVNAYMKRAQDNGISPEDLNNFGQKVAGYGLSNELARVLLTDESGPLVTQYLARNSMDAIKLTEMSDIDAALYIERNIKPKLKKAEKRKSNATPPPSDSRQSGNPSGQAKKYPLTGGKVKFL